MRNHTLHHQLAEFVTDAGDELAQALVTGADLPFEVIEQPGGPSPLYCYRPLTARFIDRRRDQLQSLPSHAPAARALATLPGLQYYVREQLPAGGEVQPGRLVEAALLHLLARAFAQRTDFQFDPACFDAAYEELEAAVYEERYREIVVAPLYGVALDPDGGELRLGDGLSLLRGDTLADAPAEAVWEGRRRRANVLAVVAIARDRAAVPAAATAQARFRYLLTALRLFTRGGFGVGPVGWSRANGGAWRVLATGASGPAPGPVVRIGAHHQDDLHALCRLVSRREPGGDELDWALARFEMGCGRPTRYEALTDHLLALRALLEPEGPASGRLCQRLAMICAPADERAALAQRVARAVSLERAVIAGLAAPPVPAGRDTPRDRADDRHRAQEHRLVDELAGHLRAVLVDVLCGHLNRDLCGVADDLLAQAAPAPSPTTANGSVSVTRRRGGRASRRSSGRLDADARAVPTPV